MTLSKKEVDEIMDILIANGFAEDVGRNDKGEIIYQLTEAGREHAELLRSFDN